MKRGEVLKRATAAVGARHEHYGSPADNFRAIARRWTAHLESRYGVSVALDPSSIAIMMADVKLARLEHDPAHADSWVDVAGYAACGGEVSD